MRNGKRRRMRRRVTSNNNNFNLNFLIMNPLVLIPHGWEVGWLVLVIPPPLVLPSQCHFLRYNTNDRIEDVTFVCRVATTIIIIITGRFLSLGRTFRRRGGDLRTVR